MLGLDTKLVNDCTGGSNISGVAVLQRRLRNLLEHVEGFSEQGTFHGITNWKVNNQLNIKGKKGLLIMEWE
jgi:hypothetical protein